MGARAGILLIRQVNKEADSLFFVSTRHSLFCVFNKIVFLHAIKEYQSKMFSGYGIRNNNSNKMRIEFIYLIFVDRTKHILLELFHLTSSKGKRDVGDIGHASCMAHHNAHHLLYAYTKSKDVGHFIESHGVFSIKLKNVLNKDLYTMNF